MSRDVDADLADARRPISRARGIPRERFDSAASAAVAQQQDAGEKRRLTNARAASC